MWCVQVCMSYVKIKYALRVLSLTVNKKARKMCKLPSKSYLNTLDFTVHF